MCGKDHGKRAKELFLEGYNCSQAVVLAFEEELAERGVDKETAARLASSFGGGLGRLREVCGCVSGMAIVSGILEGYSDPKAKEEKAGHYARIQELAGKFKEENGSYICYELLSGITKDTDPKPEARTETYYKKRPCAELAMCAAEILEKQLNREED